MAKVEEPVRVGPKVDWNGEPRGVGVGPEPTLTPETIEPAPVVTNAVTPAPVEMPWEVFKQDLETPTKTVTKTVKKRVSNKGAKYPDPKKPLKPLHKPRSRGIYEVFMRGRVRGSGVPSEIGVLEVLIPEVASYNTREAAELEAETLAKGNPGKTVEVHRRLSRMTFEATTTTKLVRN